MNCNQGDCNATQNTYSTDGFKRKLYDSLKQRNELFGYDAQNVQRLQQNYQNNYFVNTGQSTDSCNKSCDVKMAPMDYYFDLRTNQSAKAVIGFTGLTPNLYDDNVIPDKATIEKPNLYRNWEPFSTTATPVMKGCYTRFVPHEPVEVAPRQDVNYWGADLNARMYERRLISSAKEQPYANFYRRQGLINLISKNMPSRNDPYLKKIDAPSDSFAFQLQEAGGMPPAVTTL
jgi:hypothetical protein